MSEVAGTIGRMSATRSAARTGTAPARRIAVIGGSLTGLFCAAAVAAAGHEVTIVERDDYPDAPVPRRGVPQGTQTHVLLARGLSAAEELLPGIRLDLIAAGAIGFDSGDLAVLGVHGWLPVGIAGPELVTATRPLVEQVVRDRVLALEGIRVVTGRATGLHAHLDGSTGRERFTLVRRRDRGRPTSRGRASSGGRPAGRAWRVDLADGSAIDADIVIDASGRTSRLPHWLAALGIRTPDPIELDARSGYSTRIYRAPANLVGGCPGILIGATPGLPRGGMALVAENDLWLVSAVGFGEHRPPKDEEGFAAFLAGIADPSISEIAAVGEPVSEVLSYRRTSNVRHPYERVRHWPRGLVAVGDALCAFNPVYGQGITVGALEALVLRDAARNGALHSGRPLQRRVASRADTAWAIATAADRIFLDDPPPLSAPERMIGAWFDALGRLAVAGDTLANRSLNRVYSLSAPPSILFDPRLARRAFARTLSRSTRSAPRPATLQAMSERAAARGGMMSTP